MKLLPPLLCLGLSACTLIKPPTKAVEQKKKQVEQAYLTELQAQTRAQGVRKIDWTWDQAVDQLLRRNPNIIQANFQIEDSIYNTKTVWLNMIPSLRASVSDSATIENFAELFKETNFRISSFISLGNLLEMPKTIYTSRLRVISSELSSENMMRNQVIALYRIFQEQRLLKLEQQEHVYQKNYFDVEIEDHNSIEYLQRLEKHEERAKNLEKKRITWVEKVNDLFMTNYTHINLRHQTLPNINYTPNQLDFTNTSRWGYLQLNLLALEKFRDDNQIKELHSRYLPDAFLSVSAPPLFTTDSNRRFRINDFRLSPSLSWNLDTRDSIGKQIDRFRREAGIRKWEKDKRRKSEIKKLLDGRRSLKEVLQALRDNKIERREYIDLINSGDMINLTLESGTQTLSELKRTEIELTAKKIDLCTSFWLIDETRWKKITTKWKKIRLEQEAQRKKKLKGKIPFYRPRHIKGVDSE